jgi:hypothetical protein
MVDFAGVRYQGMLDLILTFFHCFSLLIIRFCSFVDHNLYSQHDDFPYRNRQFFVSFPTAKLTKCFFLGYSDFS